MTTAYTVFPNAGRLRKPFLIERVDDAGGTTLYRAPANVRAVLQPAPCATLTGVLTKVLDRGTAAAARASGFKKPAAGKTGTTDDYKDAWFIGFTTSLTAGVWVGFDKPQRTVAQGYGATMALPVWVEVMNAASEQRYPALTLRTPGEVGSSSVSLPPPSGGGPSPGPSNDATGGPPRVVPVAPSGTETPPKVEPVSPPRAEPVLKPFR
jgi:penicillin-binding protein 1A